MLRCRRTDSSDFTCFICAVSQYFGKEPSVAVFGILKKVVRDVRWTRSISIGFCFRRWMDALRCERTKGFGLIDYGYALSMEVAEEPSAAVGTVSQGIVKGVGPTRSVRVRISFWRQKAMNRC